jgi:hypothetical protein
VDAESYFKELTRYIHLNPVKAKIVKKPEDYKWSSYKGYVSKKADGYIDKGAITEVLGMTGKEYKQFVVTGIKESEDIFEDIYAGSILGKADFIKEKIKELKMQVESTDISYMQDYVEDIRGEDIIEYICEEYGVDKEELLKSRNKQSLAKKNCIYLLKRLTSKSNKEIGDIFGLSYTAISKAYSSFETEMLKNKKTQKVSKTQISHFKG